MSSRFPWYSGHRCTDGVVNTAEQGGPILGENKNAAGVSLCYDSLYLKMKTS